MVRGGARRGPGLQETGEPWGAGAGRSWMSRSEMRRLEGSRAGRKVAESLAGSQAGGEQQGRTRHCLNWDEWPGGSFYFVGCSGEREQGGGFKPPSLLGYAPFPGLLQGHAALACDLHASGARGSPCPGGACRIGVTQRCRGRRSSVRAAPCVCCGSALQSGPCPGCRVRWPPRVYQLHIKACNVTITQLLTPARSSSGTAACAP